MKLHWLALLLVWRVAAQPVVPGTAPLTADGDLAGDRGIGRDRILQRTAHHQWPGHVRVFQAASPLARADALRRWDNQSPSDWEYGARCAPWLVSATRRHGDAARRALQEGRF